MKERGWQRKRKSGIEKSKRDRKMKTKHCMLSLYNKDLQLSIVKL
jgi:hypothetical protein